MAGPWEKYRQTAIEQPQQAHNGPWAKYQAAEPVDSDPGAEVAASAQGSVGFTDVAKEAAGGALSGTGAVVSGAGDLLTTAGAAIERGARVVLPNGAVDALKSIPAPSDLLFRPAGQQFDVMGKGVQGTKSEAAKHALEASTPSGDVLDPSSWNMGEDPSLAGYGLHGANLIGQFVPQAAALALPGGQARLLGMAGTGGLQAGGAAGNEVQERIASTSDAELQQASGAYRELRESGLSEDEARLKLSGTARAAAFQGAAPVGVLGGVMTNFALGPLQRVIGGSAGRRFAGGLLLDAPAEGAQEVAETVSARAATNQAIDEQRNLTENTFGDAVLGAMGGAGHASLGAVLGRPDQRAQQPAAEEDATFENTPAPAALPAPGLQGLPAPEQTFYADSQGNVQGTGPVRNVDGEMRPAAQAGEWVNPRNRADRLPGGEGMERQVERGEPAALEGQLQLGAGRSADVVQAREPLTLDAQPERAALPAPDAIVVDSAGNALRGPTAPRLNERNQGGRGMDQQAPTAARSQQDFEYLNKSSGDPFQAPGAARASKAYRDAVKAGRQPTVAKVAGGYSIRLPAKPQNYEMRPLDRAAHEAATSPNNDLPAPTPAQIEAGNYKKGKVRLHGLEIAIENPRGSERSGRRSDGSEWRHTMSDHYGYIKRTTGADGEQVDVYLGPQEQSDQVFVVDQLNQQDGSFDEHKVMIGYPDQESAVSAYRENFDADWKVGSVVAMPVDQFKGWLKGGDLVRPAAEQQPRPATLSAKPAGPRKGPRRAVDRDRDSLVKAVIRLGGIKTNWRQDTTGDIKGNKHVPGVGALWSDKTGTSIDDMASKLDEIGFVPAGEMDNLGGVPWLQSALRDELAGLKVTYAPDSVAQQEQMEQELADRYADEQTRAEDEREAEYARIEAEYGPEIAAQAREYDEAAKAYDEQVLAEIQRFEDEHEQRQQEAAEIDDALDGEPLTEAGAAARDEQLRQADDQENRELRASARPEEGQIGETESGFNLEQQSERSLKDQAERQAQAAKAKAEADRKADEKRQADADRDDFLLTGSDRSADVAEARGQNDMFGAPPRAQADRDTPPTLEPKKPTAAKIDDFGEKIGGARKDRAAFTGARPALASSGDSRPAWARRFEISQVVNSSNTAEVGRWEVRDNRSKDWMKQPRKVGSYATREEAEQAVPLIAVAQKHRVVPLRHGDGDGFEIWRTVSERKRVKVVDQVFPSREAAMEYMAANAQQIIETNTTFGEADLPRPENAQRIGAARREGPVKDRAFIDTFGFRGVEFGNWNNQEERQQLLDDAYDGLLDLAEVMDIPPKAISLNGELALAFGARGHGLSGARAHYEPPKAAINLTKMNGAGSLAHEWFHALDHYFGRQDGKASAEWVIDEDGTRSLKTSGSFEREAVSSGFSRTGSGVRLEVRQAYTELMDTMQRKAEQYVEDTARADSFVARSRKEVADRLDRLRADLAEQKNLQYWKRHNKPATGEQLASFDTVAQQILDGVQLETELRSTKPEAPVRRRNAFSGMRWTNDALEQLSAIYKAVRGRSGFSADNNGELDRLRGAMGTYSARLKMLADAQEGGEKTKQVPTQFAMDAKELDQGRGTDYWTTPHEMAARAFQGYVEDMIAERGGSSPFLNYGPESAVIPTPWGWKRPFPTGAERKAINQAFDKLVDAIETRETEAGVQLYRQGSDQPEAEAGSAPVSAEQLREALKASPELAGVEVVQDFEDLPLSTRTRAWRDGVAPQNLRGVHSSGKTYVVASNHSSLADAIYTAVHEEVGHRGIRGLLGEELDATMERLYSSQAATAKGRLRIGQIRDAYAQMLAKLDAKQQRVLIAQEMIAHLLEDGDRPTVLQRVLSKIRELLRKLFPQVPWTYTDILALGEQSRAWLRSQQEGSQQADDDVLYSRRGWSADFPDTALAHPLSFLNNHPDYPAAKAGDDAAALRVARDAVTPAFIEQVRALIPAGSKPRIVPVLAVEGAGKNRIPLMAAEVLAQRLGLETDTRPVQAQKVGRTQSNALERIANQPTFAGEVAFGDFLIIDDTLTQGGTLAQLKTHIEDNGGRVVGAVALTGKNYSRKLALQPNTLAEVRGKYGDLESWWRDTFGYGFEGLTQSEARTLLTFDKGQLSSEQLRDRVAAARDAGLFRVGQAAAGDRSGTEAPVDPDDTLYSLGAARRPHTSEAFPDLSAAEQAALRKIAPPTARERAIDWYRERTDRLMTKIRQGLVDRYAALKELDERLHGSDFLDTSITSSAWVLARMAPAAAGALNSMLHNGRLVFDAKQKVISTRDDGSMGLGEVLSRLGEAKEIERFLGWIAGNRAAKLAAEGRENLFSAQDIAALKGISRGNTADGRSRAKLYDEVFREFQQYRDDVLAIAEQTGIISAENRAMWRDEFYVPFYRVMDEEAKTGAPRASKGLSRQEAYKKLKGGKQNLNDLLENTLMNFNHLLTASLKNQAAAQAIDNAIKLEIAQEVKESARDPKSSTFVLKGGERVWYQIDDPLVFEALTSLADPGLNNFAVRTMAKFKRVFTNMTTITPQFIVANFLRDSMQAAATTPVSKNVPANMFQGIKAYRDQKIRAQMLASGGAFSFGHIYGADPEEVKAGLRRSLRGAKLLDGPALVPKVLMAGWDAYNEIANTAENGNRAAAFTQNQDKGALRAAYEARDLMDFSQEGAWPAVRFLVRTVPFLNARLQGLDKLYRSGVKPGVLTAFGKGTASDKVAAARFATVAGALAVASMVLYLANHDDEEYRKLEDWQKDSYWFFRIGDQAFFLPKPFEVGAISTLAERTLEQFVDDKATGKLFRERLQAMLTQTFSFSPVPQMFQPALDVYANKDAFTGRPIESAGMERVSPTLRARATTTAPAKVISHATSVLGDGLTLSPLQADHLIQGYLGQVGAWAAGITDTIWRTANGETEPAKRWSEYQPIKRFYRDLGAPAPYDRYSTLFYEGLKESGRVYADVKRLQELGRLDEARELVQEKRGELAMRKSLNQTQRQLSAINARMDVVRHRQMDAESKRWELDRLLVIKSRLTERAGKMVEEVKR